MTYKDVKTMLDGVGIPTAYYQFNKKTAQQPPFICFYYPNNNDFIADDQNYQKIEHLIVELYTDNKDFVLEHEVETVLTAHGLVYSRQETPLDDEQMFMVIYETDVLITKEN